MNILHLDCSPGDVETSYSRQVSAALVAGLKKGGEVEVTYRDLARSAPPHIDGALRAGWTSEAGDRTPAQVEIVTRSEGLIAELKHADVLVIGAPMYNFSVPSTLKAWIDHIAIAGQTFSYTAEGPVGLLTGKTAYLALASGGIYSAGPAAGLEHLDTYLRGFLGFLGFGEIQTVRVEGIAFGPDAARNSLAAAVELASAIMRPATAA